MKTQYLKKNMFFSIYNFDMIFLEETKSFAMSVGIAAPCQCAQQSKDLHIFIQTTLLKKLRIKGS